MDTGYGEAVSDKYEMVGAKRYDGVRKSVNDESYLLSVQSEANTLTGELEVTTDVGPHKDGVGGVSVGSSESTSGERNIHAGMEVGMVSYEAGIKSNGSLYFHTEISDDGYVSYGEVEINPYNILKTSYEGWKHLFNGDLW